MPYWKPLVVDGSVIDLPHREPFEFQVIPARSALSATVRVVFNNHCSSEAFDPARHGAPLPDSHTASHEKRGFDLIRYELGRRLPHYVRGFDGKRIAQTRSGTLVRITLADGMEYGIFFTLKRTSAASCETFLVSAYPLHRPKESVVATGEMKFNVAVVLVLSEKTPKFPTGRL